MQRRRRLKARRQILNRSASMSKNREKEAAASPAVAAKTAEAETPLLDKMVEEAGWEPAQKKDLQRALDDLMALVSEDENAIDVGTQKLIDQKIADIDQKLSAQL